MPSVVNPTLLQIRQRVRMFIDEPQQANFTDANLNWAINAAQQEVATEISLVDEQYFVATTPTIITAVAGQRFYPLATDLWKIVRLEDVNTGLKIPITSFNQQENYYGGPIPPLVNIGQAGYTAAIVGNSLAFTPTPGASGITSQYWFVPVLPDMTSDSDTSQIPRAFIDLLAIQAAMDAMIEDEADTGPLERKYNRRFNQLVRGTRDRQQQDPRSVSRVSDSGGAGSL